MLVDRLRHLRCVLGSERRVVLALVLPAGKSIFHHRRTGASATQNDEQDQSHRRYEYEQ
jgi:hypothetical protein